MSRRRVRRLDGDEPGRLAVRPAVPHPGRAHRNAPRPSRQSVQPASRRVKQPRVLGSHRANLPLPVRQQRAPPVGPTLALASVLRQARECGRTMAWTHARASPFARTMARAQASRFPAAAAGGLTAAAGGLTAVAFRSASWRSALGRRALTWGPRLGTRRRWASARAGLVARSPGSRAATPERRASESRAERDRVARVAVGSDDRTSGRITAIVAPRKAALKRGVI